MPQSLEQRVEVLERELRSAHSLLLKLVNRELALRALAYSSLEFVQPEQRLPLAEQYERYLIGIAEQMPPGQQLAEILEEFASALREKRG